MTALCHKATRIRDYTLARVVAKRLGQHTLTLTLTFVIGLIRTYTYLHNRFLTCCKHDFNEATRIRDYTLARGEATRGLLQLICVRKFKCVSLFFDVVYPFPGVVKFQTKHKRFIRHTLAHNA